MAKKLNSLSDLGLVYSTNKDFIPSQTDPDDSPDHTPLSNQKIRVRPESVKGGKFMTRISGFNLPDGELEKIAKSLKTRIGVGGSAKDQAIIIQGNQVEKVIEFLKSYGFKDCKRSGG